LLVPSLLFFSRSGLLFLVLYTLNVTARQMIAVVFPFVIADLYFSKRPAGRYNLAWLLPVSIHIIQANALVLAGPFRMLSLDEGQTVFLLTLAAIVFFAFSLPILLLNPRDNPKDKPSDKPNDRPQDSAPIASAPNTEDILRMHHLSERETQVALLMVQEGLSDKEMGERLYISPFTVRDHVTRIYHKFNVKTRAEFLAKVLNREQ
jgi:DNA-binding CsgD family transcriptional regulator